MKHTGCNLEIRTLNNSNEQNNYRRLMSEIDSHNPFYKFELLKLHKKENSELKYFLFKLDEKPIIIMPFLINTIFIKGTKTTYKDAESPYGYNGPLFNQKLNSSFLIDFWNAVDCWYENNNVISEFTRFSLNNNYKHYSGTLIDTLKNIKGSILQNQEDQWKHFKQKVRKNYNTAKKNMLTFNMYDHNITQENLNDFYRIYEGTMNRKNAENRYYFSKNELSDLISNNPESCALAFVSNDGVPISSELFLLSKDTLYSFLGGTDAQFFNMRPNDFLKVNAITWGRDHNYSYYVLGGGRTDGDGLHTYKKSFFPNDPEIDYKTGRKIINKEVYKDLVEKTHSIQNYCAIITEGLFPMYKQQDG